MRAGCIVALVVAGCSFDVIGTNVGDPAGGPTGTPSPTQSLPDSPDMATTTPPPSMPPPSMPPGPDMSQQPVGTACTSDAQCGAGLFCAKSFGVGPGRIDIPGGYCTLDCSSTACPADSFCSTFTFGKYCLSSCPPDPCRTGYKCCDEGGGKNGCATDSMCTATGGKGK
jgi:hypothetical protein